MIRKLLIGVTSAVLLFGTGVTPSFAKKGKSKVDAEFKKVDTNSDGKISPAEFKVFYEKHHKKSKKGSKKQAAAAFRKLDKNKDGFLSPKEFKKAEHKKKKKK